MLHPIRRFSLLFTARTGSSYLQTAFMNHPNMFCGNESRWNRNRHTQKLNGRYGPGGREPVGNLERIISASDLNERIHYVPTTSTITHSGIKVPLQLMIHLQNISPSVDDIVRVDHQWPNKSGLGFSPKHARTFRHHFWRNNVFGKPILVCTRNPLRSYISWQLVKKNQDRWSHKPYDQPVQIDIKAATRYIAGVNKMLQPFLEMQSRVLILKYEDGVKVNYRKALKFLGVSYRPPSTTHVKQTTKPLRDLVVNYGELKKSRLWYFLSDE